MTIALAQWAKGQAAQVGGGLVQDLLQLLAAQLIAVSDANHPSGLHRLQHEYQMKVMLARICSMQHGQHSMQWWTWLMQ